MNTSICQREHIAAYVDGELDHDSRLDLERHIEQCASCTCELKAQRLFLCELDAVLAERSDHSVPKDFAQHVAVYAESDMSGVRDWAEHKRAFRFCIVLGLAAFILLGASAADLVTTNIYALVAKTTTLAEFAAGTLYDTAASATVISKVVSKSLIVDTQLPGMFFLLFILAALLLSLLIGSYHRTRAME